MPYVPHVFFTQKMSLLTWTKQRRETIDSYAELQNVFVIIGHGQTYMQNGLEQWKFFGTGKPVEETARAYQKFAREHFLPPIDVVLACRGEKRIPSPLPGSGVMEVLKVPAPILVTAEYYAPYIFPNDFVGASGIITDRNEGVESVRAITESWQGLREWQGYWNRNQRIQPDNVPVWAKQPSR
jgi:hypothetical protein